MTTPIDDKTSLTDDERIDNVIPLPPPEHLIRFFPIQATPVEALVGETRRGVRQILHGRTDRLLVVIGPCSIHDPAAALEYAGRLAEERTRHRGELELLMRVYFEKPRTSVGWKGLINDPYLNGSFRINEGLRIARDVLVRINQAGVPAGCEFLDVISPQYIGDLVSWGAIGARTTESQTHREMASGLSMPVGFKNATDGGLQVAISSTSSAPRRPRTTPCRRRWSAPGRGSTSSKAAPPCARGCTASPPTSASTCSAVPSGERGRSTWRQRVVPTAPSADTFPRTCGCSPSPTSGSIPGALPSRKKLATRAG